MSGVENSTYVGGLNQLNPESQDFISQGDDHLKLIKKCLLNTFPGFSRPIDGALFPWSQTPGAITVYAKFLEQTGRIGALEYFTSPSHPDGAILRANNNLSDIADPAQARVNLGIPALADVLLKSQNLADVPSVVDARNNLGVPAATDVLYANSNLSDLQDVAIARQNLDVHSKAATLEKSQNLADVPNANTARANLGAAAQTDVLLKAQNLADVPDKAAARVNLDVPSNADLVSAISAALIGLSAVTSVNGQLGNVVLGAADVGAAELDINGKVLESQMPRYLYADLASFPADGAAGAIHIAQDTGKLYRWVSTGVYAELAPSPEEVQQYANLAAFPVTGEAATLYIAADTGLVYRWDGSAYAATGLQPIADQTILGNVSGSTTTPTALTKTQVRTLVLPRPLTFEDTAPAAANAIAAPSVRAYAWGSGHTLGTGAYGAIDSVILGGTENTINDSSSSLTGAVIAGGNTNKLNLASYAFIGAGQANIIGVNGYGNSPYAVICGGHTNSLKGGAYAFLGAGYQNIIGVSAASGYSVLVGGDRNGIGQGTKHFIGGGQQNTVDGVAGCVVVGGQLNKVLGTTVATSTAFVGGGYDNWAGHATASASYSVAVGGYSNRAQALRVFVGAGKSNAISPSCSDSVIVGGDTNTITAGTAGSIGGGFSNAVSANHAVIAGGYDNTVSAAEAVVGGGRGNLASGTQATVPGGFINTADGDNSFAYGAYAHTQSRKGASVHAAGAVTTGGDVQSVRMILRGQTTNATPKVLTADLNAAAAAANNTYSLVTYQLAHIKGTVVGRDPAALADHAVWEFAATIYQDASAASTALVAAVTPTLVSSGGTGGTWVLSVTADTTIGGLAVTVTGEAGKTITWGCKLEGFEVRDIS